MLVYESYDLIVKIIFSFYLDNHYIDLRLLYLVFFFLFVILCSLIPQRFDINHTSMATSATVKHCLNPRVMDRHTRAPTPSTLDFQAIFCLHLIAVF